MHIAQLRPTKRGACNTRTDGHHLVICSARWSGCQIHMAAARRAGNKRARTALQQRDQNSTQRWRRSLWTGVARPWERHTGCGDVCVCMTTVRLGGMRLAVCDGHCPPQQSASELYVSGTWYWYVKGVNGFWGTNVCGGREMARPKISGLHFVSLGSRRRRRPARGRQELGANVQGQTHRARALAMRRTGRR
ncbi:hypothetical protein DENSPDRAFT_230953 [Dentipellis sp. KUC8613]|nr:hypothetical protein DENSPDRAFT_230953 [Dentipellis sp. KUC8613]